MSNQKRTNIATALTGAGLSDLTVAMDQAQIETALRIVQAGNGQLSKAADNAASDACHDVFVLAPAASQANTITVVMHKNGHDATQTIEIADNGSDALSVTYTSGAIKINLADSTDSNNTLTLILAALNALNTSTNKVVLGAYITGTASTQMVHGGTNTRAAVAAGGAVGGGLKSSTAGVAGFSYLPN